MAAKDMTIAQLKERKKKLDDDIFKLIQEFEKDTGMKISYLDLDREWDAPVRHEHDPKVVGVTSSFDQQLL